MNMATSTLIGSQPSTPESWVLGACVLALGGKLVLDLVRRYYLEAQKAPLPYPLPPGPPGLPFVGNVIGINTEAPWLTYTEWAKTYGTKLFASFHVKRVD